MKRVLSFVLCLIICVYIAPVTTGAGSRKEMPPELPDDSWIETTDPFNHISIWDDDSRLRTSGIFTYRILHRTEKMAAIVSVNKAVEDLTIPAVLDGYKIFCVGMPRTVDYHVQFPELPGKLKDSLKSLTVQEGVQEIGEYAFSGCKKLTSLKLPKNLAEIGCGAFSRCTSLRKVKIQDSKYITGTSLSDYAFSGCVLNQFRFEARSGMGEMPFRGSRIKEVVFPGLPEFLSFDMDIDQAQIGKIWVDSPVYSLDFHSLGWDYHRGILQKLIVNGKKTKVQGWNRANIFGSLYTVPKAACIKWAKKYKLTYKVKSCGKMGKVTRRKKKASWNKVTTTVKTYQYKESRRKWKKSSRRTKTYYQVYGKKKKSGTYKLLKTTTKNSYKSKYKYLKVKPVTVWL